MNKSILLLGTGPLKEIDGLPFGFPQLRFWSIKKALESAGHKVKAVHIGHQALSNIDTVNPDRESATDAIKAMSLSVDAVVSAGPFLPSLAACWANENRPLWIDWPSDPLADWNARIHAENSEWTTEAEAAVMEIVEVALHRSDAIGVISDRQKWATIGQLLFIGRHQSPLHSMVKICPVAYDFPYPMQIVGKRAKTDPLRIILCGTTNAWFDDQMAMDGLTQAFKKHPKLEVIWTGGPVIGHYEAGWKRVEEWAASMKNRVLAIKRPTRHELMGLIAKSHVGLWCDKEGVEPLLGSRTRALFMAWMGLRPMGSTRCEMSINLAKMGLLTPVNSATELCHAISKLHQDQNHQQNPNSHSKLMAEYGPDKAYAPLLTWLENPTITEKNKRTTNPLSLENRRLKQRLAEIHNSATWRASAKLKQMTSAITKNK